MQSAQQQSYFFIYFLDRLIDESAAQVYEEECVTSPLSEALDYKLADGNFDSKGGAKTRFRNNINAIKLIHELEQNQTAATIEQQSVLAQYCGWGGLAAAFDENNEHWRTEYAELKELLSSEDYRLANESTLSAFYTSKTVVDSVYEGLRRLGFQSGTVLEPAVGIGNFIGLTPPDFHTKFHGVELDNITGKIAKYLYPKADIEISGFENTNFPDGFFDAVVTNVPFGSFKVYDEKYERHNLFIHDYFILKSLDKLRAGGIAAIVTSKGTMDKSNSCARDLFASRAELIGAVRLPNNAFKGIANTEVTSDILFFQKRAELLPHHNESWIGIAENADGIPLNQYFIDHPEMALGTMVKGKSMYGGDDEIACVPDGRDLRAALSKAVQNLPSGIYTNPTELKKLPKSIADYDVRNYCYAVIDERVYYRAGDELLEESLPYQKTQKLKAMIELRLCVRNLLDIQIQNCSDEILAAAQAKLNSLYNRFVARYGAINLRENRSLFRKDADFTLLLSLEDFDEANGRATKTDIFSKRTIKKYTRPTSAETALEALYIAKNETGKVDLQIIQELTGKEFSDIIAELDGHVYLNPLTKVWETAAEYLSGNVREKLILAQSLAPNHPEFEKNAEALLKVQPAPLTASEISVRLGVSWVSPAIYKQFITEKFQIAGYNQSDVFVEFNKFSAEWKVDGPYTFQMKSLYGTDRINGYRIFEHALNLQTPSVYDTVNDNGQEKRVLNKVETIAAREKLRIIQEEFKAWIFDEPERRQALVKIYNDRFNNSVLAQYDGGYLVFPEMNPAVNLKPYQKDAVERIIVSGNTLLHHVVGAGKTFEIAAACMKLRQLKLAQKPMIVVPNHLTYQWAAEFRKLYPNAKLLIATKKDFEKENRLRFVSRIAVGDWDTVVIAMSPFEKLPISAERQERKIQEEIDTIEDAIRELQHKRDSRISVKNLQKVLKNKKTVLEALSKTKKDSLIIFENLGVDYLFVDEAHKYKNKFIFTKMNVAGISRAMSKRSTDLDMKIDYITELHGGQKGVVFATGTPISNSMVEMYTMKTYLAKQDLIDAGLRCFDDWAANFGETVTALELAPSGKGYRTKTRFAKFVNLPELLKMYRSFSDVKTADMLALSVPKANRRVITIKPTDEILRLGEIIVERAEKINAKEVKPEVDNMLRITGDGKKLALDPRCFDPSVADDNGNKANICAENIYRIWQETKATRRTQLVFCDLSTPKTAFKDYNPETDFDVYNHLKFRLVQMDVPENEIAFIHDATTDDKKHAMFESVRTGKVRILLGSTEKCGAGTNVQNRLIAIHHLDTPYRPSDMEQREGRGIRQGNENPEIEIYTYVTERTFDAYSYQILENKQRFISQINRGDLTVREASDIDETTFTYAEIKAITSANPLIKRKNEVELELGNLRVLQTQYKRSRYTLQDNITIYLPRAIEKLENAIEAYKQDIVRRDKNATPEFFINIAGRNFTERKEAAELYHKLACNKNAGQVIARFNGFEITPEFADNLTDKSVLVKGFGTYRVPVSESALGSLTRLENFFRSMAEALSTAEQDLTERQSALKAVQAEINKPFEHEQRILDLSTELAGIEAELDLDKKETPAVVDDSQFQSEIAKVETDIEYKNESEE